MRAASLSYLILAGVFLLTLQFQDFSVTQRYFGKLGANLSIFILPAWFLLGVLVSRRAFLGSPALRRFALVNGLFVLYLCAVSAAFLTCFLPYEARQQILWIKAIKVCITFIVWLGVIGMGAHLAVVAPKQMRLWALIAYLSIGLLVVGEAILGDFPITGFEWYHYSNPHQFRIRLFTPEASLLGALILSLIFIILLLMRGTFWRFVLLVSCVPLLLLVQSRGTLIGLASALASVALFSRKRWIRGGLPLEILVRFCVGVACLVVMHFTYLNIKEKMDEHHSVATRSVFAFSAWHAVVDKPFGAGWSGYLVYGNGWLESARAGFGDSFTPESQVELNDLIYSKDDEAFAGKNLLSTYIWWGGIPGLLVFFTLVAALVSVFLLSHDVMLRMSVVMLIVSFSTYETGLYQYSTPLLLGLVLAKAKNLSSVKLESDRTEVKI
jgi:hypothetical protein